MKRFLALFLLLASSAAAQGYRFDSQISQELLTSQIVNTTNVLVVPSSAQVAFCNFPANAVPCTNKATTFTSVTLATPCSTSTQIVLTGTSSCVASPDAQQNWGVWVATGQYSYTITLPGGVNLGPYVVNVGVPLGTNLSLGSLTTTGPNNFGGSSLFPTLDIGASLGLLHLSTSADSCCTGFLKLNSGFEATSSLVTNGGAIVNVTNDSYVAVQDNGFQMFVQAGPRPLSLLATTTLTWPDLTQHTAVAASGFVLGAKTSNIVTAHIPVFGTTSNDGYMVDSTVSALGGSVTLPTNTNAYSWINGGNTSSITAPAFSSNLAWTPPNFSSTFAGGFQCGTIAANGACANTSTTLEHCVSGIATLAGGTSTITGISPAFTSATSYFVVTNDITTIANPNKGVPVSASSITFTGTGTDNIQFIACGG